MKLRLRRTLQLSDSMLNKEQTAQECDATGVAIYSPARPIKNQFCFFSFTSAVPEKSVGTIYLPESISKKFLLFFL